MFEAVSAALLSWGPAGLAVGAFCAGSVLPFPSEALLAALVAMGRDPWPLVALATTANVLGAATLVAMGRGGRELAARRLGEERLARGEARFRRWGRWLLLLSWAPWIGDVFVLVAGVARVRWRDALPLLFVGKGLRYALVAAGVRAFL